MTRMRLLVAAALGASLWAVAPAAHACSCAPQSEAEAFRKADAVFRGTVVGRHDPHAGDAVISSGRPVTYTFAVDEVDKGDVSGAARVSTAAESPSCGYPFAIGGRYRVFAVEGEGGLTTSLCASTERLHRAGGREPYPAPEPAPLIPLVAGLVTAGAFSALAFRTRRQR